MKPLLEISLCNACVNACPYCIMKGHARQVLFDRHGNAEGGGVYLDPARMLAFAEQMQARHPEGLVIALTGGEPMCHPALECILVLLSIAKRSSDRLVLFTSLKLLTDARAEAVNEAIDYAVIGFHPSQKAAPGNRDFKDARTRAEFGEFEFTGREWLKKQLGRLEIPFAVNFIAGASEPDARDFERWAAASGIGCVKTPRADAGWGAGMKGCHIQLKPAPDMLQVRPDGTIIRCSGQPEPIGSIYEGGYDESMLCKRNCSLCPSYWPFFNSEHLFEEV